MRLQGRRLTVCSVFQAKSREGWGEEAYAWAMARRRKENWGAASGMISERGTSVHF